MSPLTQKMEHYAKILQTKKCKWTSQSIILSQQTFGSFTSAEVNTAHGANNTSVFWEKRRGPGSAQSAPSPLSHLALPDNFCHCGAGRVLGQTSFSDSSYSCPSKCCPVAMIQSLEGKEASPVRTQSIPSTSPELLWADSECNGPTRRQNSFGAGLLGFFPLKGF